MLKKSRVGSNILLYGLLCASILVYSAIYFNNTYPISEGWGINYAELMFHGKVPYRDFYYYLPPLNLLVDSIFWKLSFGNLLVFRFWYLLQRLAIFVLMFKLLRRYYNPYIVLISSIFAAVLATGDVYDLIGDYNQTLALLTVLLVYCATNFVSSESRQNKLKWLFGAGITLGLLFLTKQTIFLACTIVYFLALSFICFRDKDKDYLRYCIVVIVGAIIPIGISSIILAVNGAFIPFIEQVFINVDGKGSLFDIIFSSILTNSFHAHIWSICFLICGIYIVCSDRKEDIKIPRPIQYGIYLIVLGTILYLIFYYKKYFISFCRQVINQKFVFCAIGLCILSFVCMTLLLKKQKADRNKFIKSYSIMCVASWFVLMGCTRYFTDFAAAIHNEAQIFQLISREYSVYLLYGAIILLIARGIVSFKSDRTRNDQLMLINCGGVALVYASLMACGIGVDIPAHGLKIVALYTFCESLSFALNSKIISYVIKGSIVASLFGLCIACVAQKTTCSYSWWGSRMAPASEKIYTVDDVPAMRGIKVSADQKELYETVTKVLRENTDEDSVIYGYPHIKLFNVLMDNYNMDTFVPVLFYDVCADVYVEKELTLLKENLPDIIIWEDIPGCIETHEKVFREGKTLKQREIINFLFNDAIPNHYTVLTNVDNVTVYKLNDDGTDEMNDKIPYGESVVIAEP